MRLTTCDGGTILLKNRRIEAVVEITEESRTGYLGEYPGKENERTAVYLHNRKAPFVVRETFAEVLNRWPSVSEDTK